jgi:hypothetical protein
MYKMKATTILGIIAIIAALGAVTLSVNNAISVMAMTATKCIERDGEPQPGGKCIIERHSSIGNG